MMKAKGLAAAGDRMLWQNGASKKPYLIQVCEICVILWLPLPLPSPSDSIDAAGEATRAGIMHVKIGHLAIGKKLLD
jgi:hypothetical protein